MRMHVRMTLVVVLATLCSAGCSRSKDQQVTVSDAAGAGVIKICVVNYPLRYFAERIGGDRVAVDFPAPSDGDPAFWTPTAEDISRIQEADLILLNGADYAKWVAMVSLPQAKTINTSTSIKEQFIPLEEATTHSHGPEGEHAHGGMAFTTWLDPKLAVRQARAILSALTEQWPEHKEQFETGFAGLEKDLLDVDAAIDKAFADEKDTPLVFSHPVYQYFERRYGLNGRSVHWEPDEVPTDEQLTKLADLLKSHEAKWMVWEGEPEQETVTRLREMGIDSVVFDPCGNVPEDGDYLDVMRENLNVLSTALGASAPEATSKRSDNTKLCSLATHARLGLIHVSEDGTQLVCAECGSRFIAWGFNYDHDASGRLIEDYWQEEWPTVVEDFNEMKDLGANLVRVHLQLAKFMEAADRPNEGALEQLGRLVELAETTGLHLDITGLGCYHRKDVPEWYDVMDEAQRWKVQAVFWEAVAKTCAKSNAVFCYDLTNRDEGSDRWRQRCARLTSTGGRHLI